MSDPGDTNSSGAAGRSSRPRPQYGEYATPEEQRAAIKDPLQYEQEAPSDAPLYGQQAQPPLGAGSQHPWQTPTPPPQQQPLRPAEQPHQAPAGGLPRQRSGMGDRFATFFLLGFGLLDVIGAVSGASSYSGYIVSLAQTAGLTGLKAADIPGWVGYVIAGVDLVLWLVTLFLSMRSLRRGRLSFWIPLAGGVAAGLITGIIAGVVLVSNPDFSTLFGGGSGSSGTDT